MPRKRRKYSRASKRPVYSRSGIRPGIGIVKRGGVNDFLDKRGAERRRIKNGICQVEIWNTRIIN